MRKDKIKRAVSVTLKVLVVIGLTLFSLMAIGILLFAAVVVVGVPGSSFFNDLFQVLAAELFTVPEIYILAASVLFNQLGPKWFGNLWTVSALAVIAVLGLEISSSMYCIPKGAFWLDFFFYAGAILPGLLVVYTVFCIDKKKSKSDSDNVAVINNIK